MSLAAEVVWSRSRRRTWNDCRRRYRLRYHGNTPELEACRQLLSEHQWTVQIFFDGIQRALKEAGYGVRSIDAGALARQADRRITAQWTRSRKDEPLLSICQNRPDDPAHHEIPARVRKRVRAWFTAFADSTVLARLLAAPLARRRPPLDQRLFDASGVAAAAPPLWSRLDDEGLTFSIWSITKQPPADAAEWAPAALLACRKTGIMPERIRCEVEHLDGDSDSPFATFVFDAPLLIEEQNRILEDSARWRQALHQPESGFPASPTPYRCIQCAFLSQCPDGQELLAAQV